MALELNSEWHEAEVLKYLEGKYGEEFQINKVRGASWAYNFKTAWCSPVADPDIQFEVRRSKEDGFLQYLNCDGYLLELMNQELYVYIKELTEGKWEDFEISTSITTTNHIIDVPYTKGMTLKEFVDLDKWQLVYYNVGIYINAKDLDPDDGAAMDAYFMGEPVKLYDIYERFTHDGENIGSILVIYFNDSEYKMLDLNLLPAEQRLMVKNNGGSIFWTVAGQSSEYYPNTLESIKELYRRGENNE